MRALQRKLLRDLWHVKGQVLAISLVMGAGVTMFVMYLSTFDSLRLAQATYYERYRFADVFLLLKRAPLSLLDRLKEIPGVGRVDARVVVDVTLDVAGYQEPVSGRLIGVPVPRRPMLNDVFLRLGRFPSPEDPDEVLVGEAFALAHGLSPGDRLGALINGRRRELRIVGLGLSPEYVYNIRPGEMMPDDARFGTFWMSNRALAAAFNMEGGFNNLALTLVPGAMEAEVIAHLDRMTASYGSRGAIPRSLQTSHWYLDSELRQLQTVGLILPIVFLIVAAFLLNVVLTRIVSVQREQIAALKALGYSNLELAGHYGGWGLAVGGLGGAVGVSAGSWLGTGMTAIYQDYFRFPDLVYNLPFWVALLGALISLTTAVLGALGAVRRAVRLPPAEAMRPEAPARYRESWLERSGLRRWLKPPARMVLRNVGRHPFRTATSVTGISLSVSLLILGTFFMDSIDVLMDLQFNVAQRQDLNVTFVEPASSRALHEMISLPGILETEPTRAVPVRLRVSNRSRQTALMGVPSQPRLFRVVDASSGPLVLPEEGLVMSTAMAEILQVDLGDSVTVEVLEGRRPVVDTRVSALVEEYMGTPVYMEISALQRLLGEGPSVSGVFLLVDEAHLERLYDRLKRTPRVAAVSLKGAALQAFNETLAETFYVMVFFNLMFSGVIAFGVVYNAAHVALAERSRELASLRVLGYTRAEISSILLGELAVVTLIGIPVGLLLGYLFAGALVAAFSTELYRFPVVVSARTFAYSAVAVLTASTMSGLLVRRELDRLDLIAVLKTRE